ncbi:hypothetical protein FOL47_004930, partial [Perkinsus chesapeaki]
SDYGIPSKRRSLSVTFADRQPRVGSIANSQMNTPTSSNDTSSGFDASPSTTVPLIAQEHSLATYHYVESYKDYNRRNSSGVPMAHGCMTAIRACLGLLPTRRRYRRYF